LARSLQINNLRRQTKMKIRETLNKEQILEKLYQIDQSIEDLVDYFKIVDKSTKELKEKYKDEIVENEKELNLLLENRTQYKKMLNKVIN
jgi:hypothetical protein